MRISDWSSDVCSSDLHGSSYGYVARKWARPPHPRETGEFGGLLLKRFLATTFSVAPGAGAFAASGSGDAAAAEQRFLSIGPGWVLGVYYPNGGALCRLVNKNSKIGRAQVLTPVT